MLLGITNLKGEIGTTASSKGKTLTTIASTHDAMMTTTEEMTTGDTSLKNMKEEHLLSSTTTIINTAMLHTTINPEMTAEEQGGTVMFQQDIMKDAPHSSGMMIEDTG